MDGRERVRSWLPLIVLVLIIGVVGQGCPEGEVEQAETATIAPATPEPNVDVENDPALTRTVDPGEDRSPYEGGPLGDDEVIGGEEGLDGRDGDQPADTTRGPESDEGTL